MLRCKKITFKTKNRSAQSMNFRLAGVTWAVATMNHMCQWKNRFVLDEEGSYIESKASGRKVLIRVENEAGRAKVTS